MSIRSGDCLEVMASMEESSVDAIVTDPPYGLGFMGKAWDALPPGQPWAEECLRVLKPGGHLLAFGGTRTWHRLAVAIEDGGFQLRDSLAWIYGSGFPKSRDVSKAIDAEAGAVREVVGSRVGGYGANSVMSRATQAAQGYRPTGDPYPGDADSLVPLTAPATPEAAAWSGWGTALKPAFEPIVVARKPFRGTVAANVLAYGTGALNVDACRVETTDNLNGGAYAEVGGRSVSGSLSPTGMNVPGKTTGEAFTQPSGRWPANVVMDESQAAALDEPSRFFYCAKAPKSERPVVDGVSHPTVKPLTLTRWLVRLVTPPGGLVLDPFAGSGTTMEAAVLEGFSCLAIERERIYLRMVAQRVRRARALVY